MMSNPAIPPAEADTPDPGRAGPDAPTRLPERLALLISLLIRFIIAQLMATQPRTRRLVLPSWWYYRPDLPAGSMQQLAASRRGAFGNAIAWMCLRRGIGPGHKDWPELSRAIVAFGGSLARFRPGMPALGLQWWENPEIVPGMSGETVATPAADALALRLARQEAADAALPALLMAGAGGVFGDAMRADASRAAVASAMPSPGCACAAASARGTRTGRTCPARS